MIDDKRWEIILQALTEMFKRVGAEHEDVREFIKHDGWWTMYSWTSQQQNEFQKYLVGMFRKELKMRVKRAESEAQWFILHCGWVIA